MKKILVLMAAGHRQIHIHSIIGVSHCAVNKDIENMYRRLQAHTAAQAVFKACKIGLLTIDS